VQSFESVWPDGPVELDLLEELDGLDPDGGETGPEGDDTGGDDAGGDDPEGDAPRR
jgi:hypothetical protein